MLYTIVPNMKKLIICLISLFVAFSILFFGFVFYPIPKSFNSDHITDNIKIYDRHGILLYEQLDSGGHKSFVPLNRMPIHLKNAFIFAEDKRFYDHSGVDFRSILRALWQNISEGRIVSGGSTITQQLVRNIVGVNKSRTISQKIEETIIALKVSKFLSKDEIFEMYLNSIYFGGFAYGVEAASWQYYNKSVYNLDLAESALLAGLPRAPNRLNPFKNFDGAKKRQEVVLYKMFSEGNISKEKYLSAVGEQLILKHGSTIKKAPHFVDYVIAQNSLNKKELKTTLDYGLQMRVNDR